MRRALAAVLLPIILVLAGGVVLGSVISAEPASAFAGSAGDGRAVVEEARALGLSVERHSAPIAALAVDTGLVRSRTVVVQVAPDEPASAQDLEAARQLLADGAVLVVFDSMGASNSLLQAFGVAIERVRLVELDPEWTWTPDGPSLAPPLPSAVSLAVGSNASILATSSSASFLDRDGDGLIGASDPVGPFPVAVEVPYGDGLLVAVADSELVAGDATARNRLWLREALRAWTDGDDLLLMQESDKTQDPLLLSVATLRGAGGTLTLVLLAAAAVASAAVLLPHSWMRWARHRFRPDRFVRRDPVPEARASGGLAAHWTRRGVAAVCALAALVLFYAGAGSDEAALLAGLIAAAIGTAVLPGLPRLRAARTIAPERLAEGRPAEVRLELHEDRGHGADLEFLERLPAAFDVEDGHDWFEARLSPTHPCTATYRFVPSLLGRHEVGPLRVRRTDLLGLRTVEAQALDAVPVDVHPRSDAVRSLPFGTRVPTITLGLHKVNRAGGGTEFHALRQYQPGDPFRSVNWKASARTKDLMVNQRVHESLARLTVFLDARLVSGAGPASRSPLARSCRAVLSLASGAMRMRDRVRVIIYGDGVRELPRTAPAQQFEVLTETLAGLRAAGTTSLGQAVDEVASTLRPGHPVAVVTGLEADGSAPDALARLRSRGLLPFLVCPAISTVPPEAEDGPAEPGAAAIEAARKESRGRVQALGIAVYDLDSDLPLDAILKRGSSA